MLKTFEQELQRNAFLRCIWENSKVNAILVADADGYILHLNEAFQHTYGYTPDELRGKHGRVLFTEEDQKKLMPEIEVETVLQQGVCRDRNYIMHRNGSCIFTDGESVLAKTANGTPFIIKIVQNINEQKVAEKFLRDAQAFSERVIGAINEGLVVIDLAGKILKANSFFYHILGKEGAEVEGLTLSQLEDPLFTSELFIQGLQNVIAERSFKNVEIEYHPKTGDTKILCIKARFLAEDVNTKILIIISDITATKKFAESLATQVKDRTQELEGTINALKLSNARLEEFAHAASHDLKEPIRKIYTFSDRLKTELAPRMNEDEMFLFGRLENAAERMKFLVEDLLEYSYVGYHPDKKEPVDLNKKLSLVLEDLEVLIKEKNAVVIVNPLPTIKGYRRQLQQLFQNLISNAVTYSKPGVAPQICISSRVVKGSEVRPDGPEEDRNKTFYLIEVQDNGIGFEQSNAELVFRMFSRLHGKADYAGTGLGLSIARKVAENHDGYIWAESELGKGATFNILLPTD